MPLYFDKSVHIKILLKRKATVLYSTAKELFLQELQSTNKSNVSKVATAALVEEWHHMSSASVHHPHGYTGLDLANM